MSILTNKWVILAAVAIASFYLGKKMATPAEIPMTSRV